LVKPHDRIEKKFKEEDYATFLHYTMPVKWRSVTSRYGYRPRFRRNHHGVDLKANQGDTVRAVFSGIVRKVVHGYGGGYGNYLVLEHDNSVTTLYAHLSKIIVHEGEIIGNGTPIALSGNTGRSTGPHLHFEIRVLGKSINPELIFDFERGCLTDTRTVLN
jgi:murein DD-endopeptidase MepM/ murein hydrolase activator NlpD